MSDKIVDLNSNKMNTILIISKNMAQVRVAPGTSEVKFVLDKGPTEYHTTRIKKGWYFIEELKGWVYYEDVYIPHPEEIIPDDGNFDVNIHIDDDDNSSSSEGKDGDNIIEAINGATKSIYGSKILLKVTGGKMYDLNTCMSMVLDDINNADKLKIPTPPEGLNNAILTCKINKEGKVVLEWIELKNDNIVIDNEF